jgi:transposase
VVIGIDVGKHEQRASVIAGGGECAGTLRWEAPGESAEFLAWVRRLVGVVEGVEVAMEPSGTYGDALRHQLVQLGCEVYRLSPKRTHDAAEVFDGTPSLHDSKSSQLVAQLHLQGLSEIWEPRGEVERECRARVSVLSYLEKNQQRLVNRLEALLSRHWPESLSVGALQRKSFVALLAQEPSPERIARAAESSEQLLRRVSRGKLSAEIRAALVKLAGSTLGVPMMASERDALRWTAQELLRVRAQIRQVTKELEEIARHHDEIARMRELVGPKTAAVVVAKLGLPSRYRHARAFRKGLGMNLKEKSSGKHQGQLHITKRGPGVARWYLYLATLRLLQKDASFAAWHRAKVGRDGSGPQTRSIVALTRKLALALYHVACGARFDSRLLFDTQRLGC